MGNTASAPPPPSPTPQPSPTRNAVAEAQLSARLAAAERRLDDLTKRVQGLEKQELLAVREREDALM
jgi:hypothetical protein